QSHVPPDGRSGLAAVKMRDCGLRGLDIHHESTKGRKHETERTKGPEPDPGPIDRPGLFRAFVLSCFRDLICDDADAPPRPSGSQFTSAPDPRGRRTHAPPNGPLIRPSGTFSPAGEKGTAPLQTKPNGNLCDLSRRRANMKEAIPESGRVARSSNGCRKP